VDGEFQLCAPAAEPMLVLPPTLVSCSGPHHLCHRLGRCTPACPPWWLDGCLRGGLDPAPLWHRLGEQSMGVLSADAGDSRQLHAVCQGCAGCGCWWGCWRMHLSYVHLEQPQGVAGGHVGCLEGDPWPWSQPGAVHVNTSIVLAKVMSVFKLFTSVEFAHDKVWQKTVIVLMNLLDFNEEF
jgi:hypothetical protein